MLEARLLNAKVDVLLLQETWLCDSVEDAALEGFYLVGRLGRAHGPKAGYGGVAIYAKNSFASIALIEHSSDSERTWAVLHTNIGPVLIGNWYRAPDEDGSSVSTLPHELDRLRGEYIGIIIAGDLNVHHRK